MDIRDVVLLVLNNLRRMKGRVMLTAMGVIIGTASLVVLVSLGAGLQHLSSDFTSGSPLTEIHLTMHTRYEVVPGAELDGMASETPPSRCGNSVDDAPVIDEVMRQQIADLPGVAWMAVYEALLGTPEVVLGPWRAYGTVRGVEPTVLAQLGLEAARGVISPAYGEAVVGAGFAASLFDPLERSAQARGSVSSVAAAASPPEVLGEMLSLRLTTLGGDGQLLEKTVRVRVVGVLKPEGYLYDEAIYLPERDVVAFNTWMHGRRAGTRRDPARQGYTGVVIKAEDMEQVVAVEEALTDLGFPVYTERKQLEEWAAFFTALQIFLGGIGAISLVVAAFGISNTMMMAIHERTQEIGLLKAIGASNRAVITLFIAESAGIGVLGGIGGVLIGLLLNGLLSLGDTIQLAGLPAASIYTPPWLPPFAVIFAGCVGVLSGTYPARRAARLVPIVALKYE